MSWSTLSEDVWRRILEYVPLAHRLGSCSIVNRILYRAAAAATCAVAACDVTRQRLPGLCQWMTHHGQHLTSLQFQIDGTLTQLPCPNLRELDLAYMQVQLDASSSQPGVLHSCTRLTKLCFCKCHYIDSRSSLAALTALVGLQHLQLADTLHAADDIWMPSAVLQHLPHLTYLLLDNGNTQVVDGKCLEHISCLTSLQELHIAGARLGYQAVSPSLSPSTTPGLNRLTALQRVNLRGVRLDPLILQDCTQLQGLELKLVCIISGGGAAALHILLGRLQQLQSLQLYDLEYDWPVEAAAYTNLTASSLLQELHLHIDDMPAGVWPHVFRPSQHLPALRELTANRYGWDAAGPPPAAAPGTDDLSCVTACCPGLCSISITVQPDIELADLAKASSLTSLSVSGLSEWGVESLRALSGLVGLQELSVELGGPVAPQDLLCLTTLTVLTSLTIPNPEMVPAFEVPKSFEFSLCQVCTCLCSADVAHSDLATGL